MYYRFLKVAVKFVLYHVSILQWTQWAINLLNLCIYLMTQVLKKHIICKTVFKVGIEKLEKYEQSSVSQTKFPLISVSGLRTEHIMCGFKIILRLWNHSHCLWRRKNVFLRWIGYLKISVVIVSFLAHVHQGSQILLWSSHSSFWN